MAENPLNLEKLMFIGNDGIVEGYTEKDGWDRLSNEVANNSNIVLDSKNPFSWIYKDSTKQLSRIRLNDGILTGDTIDNAYGCKSIFINPIYGNTYVLRNKEKTLDGDYIYGGELVYYSYFNKIFANLTLTYNQSTYDLFGSMDMAVDYVRNKVWICDTLNHKILAINSQTNVIEYIFLSDYIFPSSLAIDISSGTVFVRAYVSTTLAEVILVIKNNAIFSVFKSPGMIGFKDLYNIDNCIVVLDRKSSQSCVYRINLDDGSIEKTYECRNQNINLLSGECLNNSMVTYGANGMMKFILSWGADLGEISVTLDNSLKIIPSIFDSSYWGYVYRSDGKHNLVNIKMVGTDRIITNDGLATFDLPMGGSIIVGERKPVLLTNSGNTIIKLSNDGNTVEKTKNLVNAYDIIDTNIKDNTIVIGKKEQTYFKTLNHLFLQEYNYTMGSNIIDISVVQNASNCYWILCSGDNLFKVRCLNGVLTILGTINVASMDFLIGVRHNFENNGAIVFSLSGIYKISSNGNSLIWQNENFVDITDIHVYQDLSTIYSGQFHYNLLTTRSMSFDSFRNKLWWIRN